MLCYNLVDDNMLILCRSPLDSSRWSCSRQASWFCSFESPEAVFCNEQAKENGS